MTAYPSLFFLNITQIEQSCCFELTWGEGGQRIRKTLPLPPRLQQLYNEWQRLYLGFYRTLELPLDGTNADDGLRGRSVASGIVQSTGTDLSGQLQAAETSLLHEFRRWLLDPDLYPIRVQLAEASQALAQNDRDSPPLDLFLTCSPLDLARLPWETWKVTAEFATPGAIRIVRTAESIRHPARQPERRRARVLAIVGGDAKLKFEGDRAMIQSLQRLADVVCVGWQPQMSHEALVDDIKTAIADPRGWDILFFAGHSNETPLTGGELGIAPGFSIQVQDILPQLRDAQAYGLQFALFNSCSGLSIADALIDQAGLSQVAIMREPIHHRVAYEFLVQFLDGLTAYKSVHESLLQACQYLQLEKQSIYPSSYCVPSLFRHPKSLDFRLVRPRIRDLPRRLKPTRYEAIALVGLCFLSWPLALQEALLDQRLGMQAWYRQITNQVPANAAPLLLVQLDDRSLQDAGRPSPLTNREYLSRLVEQATAMDASTIALDYVLDSPQGAEDEALARSLDGARAANIHVILGSTENERGEWRSPLSTIAAPSTYWEGHIRLFANGRFFSFPPTAETEYQKYPISYLLALAAQLEQPRPISVGQPSLNTLAQTYLPPNEFQPFKVTYLSYYFRQAWMHFVVDYSIPPDAIYEWIPAWEFLELSPAQLQERYGQPLVMIMPGHSDAGVNRLGEDIFEEPPATRFWRQRSTNERDRRRQMMQGGEAHAYLFYHYSQQRSIVPIPDLWMVLAAALLAKGLIIGLRPLRQWRLFQGIAFMGAGTGAYSLLSLQLYVSTGVLLPIVMPVLTLWVYLIPYFRFRKQR